MYVKLVAVQTYTKALTVLEELRLELPDAADVAICPVCKGAVQLSTRNGIRCFIGHDHLDKVCRGSKKMYTQDWRKHHEAHR